MHTAQDLLQFHFSPVSFNQSAQRIIPITLNQLNDYRIDKLQKITEAVGASSFSFTREYLIPHVFRKFKNFINNKNISFDLKELRTLTYALAYSEQGSQSILSNAHDLDSALSVLDSNWRDSFLTGLIDCFLKNWETTYRKSLERLEVFILHKLENYTGSRNMLLSFKNNKRYINTKNGDLILGDTLAKSGKSIQEATKMLSVPDSWFSYPYFSKVIVTYFDRRKESIVNEIDSIDEALTKHHNSATSKRLISKIIIQANQAALPKIQDSVKSIAFKQIGDPGNIASWTVFENASENEKTDLFKARNILNEWITRQFINVFFNVCINDERRKKFWLKYAPKISSFKVYGPMHTKNTLKRDERIAEYVDARFENVTSKRDVSAFILYIGNYILIEFSNEGYACCAYKINSPFRPNLNSRLNSVDDLRNSSMSLAIQTDANYYYHNDEGRLFHKDGNDMWETKFNSWMTQKVLK